MQSGASAQMPDALEPGVPVAIYDTKIQEFQAKLETARLMQADLDRRVACLDKMADELVEVRNVKELALGQLRTREQDLEAGVLTQQAAYEGFRNNVLTEERALQALRAELRELQFRREQQRLWIEQCKREKHWTRLWGLTCEADMNIAQLIGDIKNYEGDIAGAERRMQISHDSVEAARRNLDQSRNQLVATRDEANAVREESARTEQIIGDLRSAISRIRVVEQPFRIEIDEYANALSEARDVGEADHRPRTLRKLADISARIDAAIGRSSDAVSQTDRALGVEWSKACTH